MLESALEKIFVREVKKLGGKAYKWVSPGNAGVPDRIVILPNMTPIFVELKTESGKLTNLQKVQCNRLADYGQRVEVLHGLNDVRLFLERVKKELGTEVIK